MHNRLIIVGAGGHGRVVADIAKCMQKYDEILFLDDGNIEKSMEFQVAGTSADAVKYIGQADFFVAIGDANNRRQITTKLEAEGACIATLVHPSTVIGSHVTIGTGTAVMAGAVLNLDSVVGKGCIVNTCASVDHDCQLGDYVHVAVGAHLCGTVQVGDDTWVGAGATIINNVNVASNCILGAGAVVVKDILEAGTYVGVPAKKIKE